MIIEVTLPSNYRRDAVKAGIKSVPWPGLQIKNARNNAAQNKQRQNEFKPVAAHDPPSKNRRPAGRARRQHSVRA